MHDRSGAEWESVLSSLQSLMLQYADVERSRLEASQKVSLTMFSPCRDHGYGYTDLNLLYLCCYDTGHLMCVCVCV
jgi:hypothetical protein